MKAEVPPPISAPNVEWIDYIRATRPISAFNEHVIGKFAQQEAIGAGAAKIVYPMGHGKAFCLLRSGMSPEELKSIFYARKLVHEFMPSFVPNVYFVSSYPNSMVVEEIQGVPADEARRQLDPENKQDMETISRKVRGTINVLKQLGVQPDIYESNYLLTEEGPAIYVDDFEWGEDSLSTMEKLLKWYPWHRRVRAQRFINRLKELPAPPII